MANSVDPDQDPCCLQGNLNVSTEVMKYFLTQFNQNRYVIFLIPYMTMEGVLINFHF